MEELRKFVAPEFIFGVDAIRMTGHYARNLGISNILLVTDEGVIKAGWTEKIIKILAEADFACEVFSDVSPNPRDFECMKGAEFYRNKKCNGIIAVGGGSVIDCAKGIGIVASNNRNILQFEGVDMVERPIPPLICIPTTGGTSADVSQFAIIVDSEEKVKIAIISKTVVPDVSLIDPSTLTTMDSYLTACTGIDALVHAIEAFVSNASSPITDLHALKAIELIYNNLDLSIRYPKNLKYRTQIMLGSLEAGLAFSNASLGLIHAMAHSLGGLLDFPHGECNALLLPHVIGYNFFSAQERFEKISEILNLPLQKYSGKEKIKALLNHLFEFRTNVGISGSLSGRGLKSCDINSLAKNAFKDPCSVTNPQKPDIRDIEAIYEEAL
jgi:alcohol dehydrogenase